MKNSAIAGRGLRLFLTMLIGAAAWPAAAQDFAPGPAETLTLAAGERTTMVVADTARVAVDRAGIVAVRPLNRTDLQVVAIAPGAVRLQWEEIGGRTNTTAITVLPPLSGFAKDVSDLLRDVPNARVVAVGNKVVVDGKLITMEDMDRVARLVQAYGDQLLNLTVFDRGPSNEVVADFIRRIAGIETVRVNVVGQTAYLSGHVYGQMARSNVVTLTRAQVANVVDMLQVRDIMIETEVIFAKLTKSGGANIGMNLLDGSEVLKMSLGGEGSVSDKSDRKTGGSWGMDWSRSLAPVGDLAASENGKQTSDNGDTHSSSLGLTWSVDLMPKLNLLVNDGEASILARPRLGTKNGEIGKFHSGGEYYYEVSGVQAADLKNVEYGFQLSVQPEMISDNKILNNLDIEVSVPTSKSGSEELNLDKFQVQNTVICQLGQSIVVSGFLQNLRNFNSARTPILGDIPIIRWFFSNRMRTDEDQDLVAIVTPRVLDYDTPARVLDSISTNIHQKLQAGNFVEAPAAGAAGAGEAGAAAGK